MKKIGVVLCGSGYLDGSEIREAVGTLWALSKHSVEVQIYSPAGAQPEVVDHLACKPMPGAHRDMLQESARIARGKVLPLNQAEAGKLDGIIFPGGYGAAKNLCNFALKGSQGVVCAEVDALLRPMHAARRPIGAICIAPAILALAFRGEGLRLTVGAAGEAATEIEKLGHRHVVCAATEIATDETARVVTTPAYMCDDAPLHEIFVGIEGLVAQVVRWT